MQLSDFFMRLSDFLTPHVIIERVKLISEHLLNLKRKGRFCFLFEDFHESLALRRLGPSLELFLAPVGLCSFRGGDFFGHLQWAGDEEKEQIGGQHIPSSIPTTLFAHRCNCPFHLHFKTIFLFWKLQFIIVDQQSLWKIIRTCHPRISFVSFFAVEEKLILFHLPQT